MQDFSFSQEKIWSHKHSLTKVKVFFAFTAAIWHDYWVMLDVKKCTSRTGDDLFFSNHTISCIHDVTSPLDVKKCTSQHYQLYLQYYHILFKANQVETCLTYCMSAHIKTKCFIWARSFTTWGPFGSIHSQRTYATCTILWTTLCWWNRRMTNLSSAAKSGTLRLLPLHIRSCKILKPPRTPNLLTRSTSQPYRIRQ